MKTTELERHSSIILLILIQIMVASCTASNGDDPSNRIRLASNDYFSAILQDGYVAPARYVEAATCDGAYCMFTLADGYLHSAGYDAIIPVANFSFMSRNLLKSDRTEPWMNTLEASYREMPTFSYHSDVQPGIGSLFSAFRFFEKNGPLSKRSDYQFELIPNDSSIANGLLGIRFDPRDRGNYRGIIWLGKEDNRIRKIELEAMPFYSQNFQQWVWAKGRFVYESVDDLLVVNEITIETTNSGVVYKISLLNEHPIELNRIVPEQEFVYLERVKLNPFVVYEPSKSDALFNSFSWLDMEAVRAGLETGTTLEEQFQNNSGKPYLYRRDGNGNIRNIEGGEDTYAFVWSLIRYFDGLRDPKPEPTSDEAAEVYIPEKRLQLGKVKSGELIEAMFEVHNTGNGTLEILNVNPDCTFTEVNAGSNRIGPGEKTIIQAAIHTANMQGRIAKHITLETNTPTRFHNLSLYLEVE